MWSDSMSGLHEDLTFDVQGHRRQHASFAFHMGSFGRIRHCAKILVTLQWEDRRRNCVVDRRQIDLSTRTSCERRNGHNGKVKRTMGEIACIDWWRGDAVNRIS
ncbi:hypothetical protein H310_12122 [Aphanomyces invadans]|uniref:Uncharacterized protein n=1 Tax=Aphanomyces invadans TaxID=157072 RepID=A0A024TKG2_9STRA|nr:hypothetical protein H310_12122 [Aphanomyces invadans]ETV94106.1 hypothetical protein H310_12122 [Aphanomyces invadans]|eukprot:XP_008877309.1 hypothetical protein H310_12122 [Aphanomyces invadans]